MRRRDLVASFLGEWGDRRVTNPDTGNQVKIKSLRPEKSMAQRQLLKTLYEQWEGTKKDPRSFRHQPTEERRKKRDAIITKYELQEEDLEELKENAWKPDKKAPKARDIKKIMQEFLKNATPETRERMKGMSPAEFEVVWLSVMDDDEEVVVESRALTASARKKLIKLAYYNPGMRKEVLNIIKKSSRQKKAGTFLRLSGGMRKAMNEVDGGMIERYHPWPNNDRARRMLNSLLDGIAKRLDRDREIGRKILDRLSREEILQFGYDYYLDFRRKAKFNHDGYWEGILTPEEIATIRRSARGERFSISRL